MKTNLKRIISLVLLTGTVCAGAQGNAFTYQGRLTEGGDSAQGLYDFQFTLYGTNRDGSAVAVPLTNNAVAISNGLFAVELDFGAEVFDGSARWLQVEVRTNTGKDFVSLEPRQPVLPSPYAIFAQRAAGASDASHAATADRAAWSGLIGVPEGFWDGVDNDTTYAGGTGLNLVGTTFSLDKVFTDARYWQLGGNSGTSNGTHFLGTTDDQALELKVGNSRALRLEPTLTNGAVNVIGGSEVNFVAPQVVGATIGGGGAALYFGSRATNSVGGNFGTVGGGTDNSAKAFSTVSGGLANTANHWATVGGGIRNSADGWSATISGGRDNTANHEGATIAGGRLNTADSIWATVSGGEINVVLSNSQYATIGGGWANTISDESYKATISGGERNQIEDHAHQSVIGGGYLNSIALSGQATIAGGQNNNIGPRSYGAAIGGGRANVISSNAAYGTISGGYWNILEPEANNATVGGGYHNVVRSSASGATIPGGVSNTVAGIYGFAAGRHAQALHEGTFVWADATDTDFASTVENEFRVRASGGVSFAAGSNGLSYLQATPSGLGIGTGAGGPAAALHLLMPGLPPASLPANENGLLLGMEANAGYKWIQSYGGPLCLNPQQNAVGIGITAPQHLLHLKDASPSLMIEDEGTGAAFLQFRRAGDPDATYIALGNGNKLYFKTGGGDRMVIDSAGNVGIGNSNPTNLLMVFNARCNGNSWINASDRNLKENFEIVDGQAVLEAVTRLPIQRWSYKNDPTTSHVGPVAQDFQAAFGVGSDDTGIATVDADGVALAAIQGLNRKLEEQLQAKEARICELEERLEALERRIVETTR